MTTDMKIKAIVPAFGSNRTLAKHVGAALDGCSWVGIPFAGGMSELLYITARTLLVADKHRHVINLASVLGHPVHGPQLYRRLRRKILHPAELRPAQLFCVNRPPFTIPDLHAAENYFVASWMGRSAKALTDGEFKGRLCLRWDAGGGDSTVRYQSAVSSLRAWRKVLQRASFAVLDVRDFAAKVKDRKGHGVYVDPPFMGPGDAYKHKFSAADHRWLAEWLAGFKNTRAVCRFYDIPQIRSLYPESRWEWRSFDGRKQTNATAPEVLLVSRATPGVGAAESNV